MEGSVSEAVFESLNLNPQLFTNEILNQVDTLIDGGFDYFHQEALNLLKLDGCDNSKELELGINHIFNTIRSTLDKRLSMWEQYCLHQCFTVPSGFSIPSEKEASDDDPMVDQDDVSSDQLDIQLDSLRSKLAEAVKERDELNHEVKELEMRSSLTDHCVSAVNEAMEVYNNAITQDMFQEMLRVSSELREKMKQLKSKQREDTEHNRRESANVSNGAMCNLNLDGVQEFIAEMNL